MFTGIVRHLGRVKSITSHSLAVRLGGGRFRTGDSVAVDGVCLTVSSKKTPNGRGVLLRFDLGEETLRGTTVGRLRKGSLVNIEPSLTLSGALGGHLVTGHVEGRGIIRSLRRGPHSWEMGIALPARLKRYLVPKGSVAVDGISLTVLRRTPDGFTVSLIPFTLGHTSLGSKRRGDPVNIETDILAKYVEGALRARRKTA